MPAPSTFEARLERVRQLAPSVRELGFVRVDGRPMTFEPGQWLNVFVPVTLQDATEIKRSYSIASPPDGTPSFDIALTRVQGGPASTWLHALQPGAVLTFVGPQGFFTRPLDNAPPSLMIATGTGVTPMRSMMRAAIAGGSRAKMWLLLGVRHEEDVLYADELGAMAHEHPFVRLEVTLSQPQDAYAGRRGYVQAHVRELWNELVDQAPTSPHAYICGLQRMIGSVRDLLRRDLAVSRQQVHSERYD